MEHFNLTKNASTCLKGASCLLIVLHHWCSGLLGAGSDNPLVFLFTRAGGVAGVAIFFFLSSYGLTRSQLSRRDKIGTFFTKRLAKVYIPLVITNVLWLMVRYNGQGGLQAVLQVLNLSELLDTAMWFCNVIIMCYVIFYISIQFKSDWTKICSMWLLVLIMAVAMTKMWPHSPFYVYSLVAFPIGGMVAILQDKMAWPGLLASVFTPVALLLGVPMLLIHSHQNLFGANLACCILILCLMVFAIGIQSCDSTRASRCLDYIKVPMSFVGVYSYEIYLLHNKFVMLHSQFGATRWYPLTFVVVVIPLAILLFHVDKSVNRLVAK